MDFVRDRDSYRGAWRLFTDDLGMVVEGRYYFVPETTPYYPAPHHLWSRRWGGYLPGHLHLGEDSDTRHKWDSGRLPFVPPPPTVIPAPFCDGGAGVVASGTDLPVVLGIDRRVWTLAGLPVPGWMGCMRTPDYLQKQTEIPDIITDSRVFDDGTGCVQVLAPLCVAGEVKPLRIDLPLGEPEDPPEDGRMTLYIVDGGRLYVRASTGATAPVIDGVAGVIPKYIATEDGLQPSDLSNPAANTVRLSPDSFLDLPIRAAAPDCPPAGYVRLWMAADGLRAVWPDCSEDFAIPCGSCGVDEGVWPCNNSCAEAELLTLPQTVTGTLPEQEPGFPISRWYYFADNLAGQYHLDLTELPAGWKLRINPADEPCDLGAQITVLDSETCTSWVTFGAYYYIEIYRETPGPGGDFAFTIGTGGCP